MADPVRDDVKRLRLKHDILFCYVKKAEAADGLLKGRVVKHLQRSGSVESLFTRLVLNQKTE